MAHIDRRVDALDALVLGEAAVRAGDDVLAPDQCSEPHDPVGDQARVLDRGDVVSDDAGDQDLPVPELRRLPDAPLVLVARVGRLDRVRAGLHLQDQVDQLLQRRVGDVRHVPASEADVVAHPVLRDPLQRVVESVDPKLAPSSVVLGTGLHQVVVHVRQHGVVHLDQQPGLHDRPVLVSEGVGDGVDVLALARVVLVDAVVRRRGRRDDRQERLGHLDVLQRSLEVGDVALHGSLALIGDRADADLGRGAGDRVRHLLGEELREPLAVPPEPDQRLHPIAADLEAAHAIQDVGRPS